MYLSSIYPQFFRAEKSHAFRQNFVFDGQHARAASVSGVSPSSTGTLFCMMTPP